MKPRTAVQRLLWSGLAIALVSTACLQFSKIEAPLDENAIHTAAAQTIVAQSTLAAGKTAIAQLTQMGSGGQPTGQPTTTGASPSATSTAPLIPTVVPIFPTPTQIIPIITPEIVPVPCNWARFVEDVTVPDGTTFLPGAQFVKIWRLRNVGSCSWNTNYSLVYSSGEPMFFQSVIPLPKLVRPGEVVDVSATMVAPGQQGVYRSYWMLRDPYGRNFGIGANADKAFWVEIKVFANPTNYAFDFALQMCNANWKNGTQNLPCPGDEGAASGFVRLLTAPVLENGRHENEVALWTFPQKVQDGMISGTFPLYKVQPGDHFMSDVGCLYDNPGCDVTFGLSYQVAGQLPKYLGSWREAYDGNVTRIDLDLSSLTGQTVQFILNVSNNGKPGKANAFWLVPSIRNTGGGWESNPAVKVARQMVAQALGLTPAQLTITSVETVQWSDTCLGVHLPGQVCAQAIIPGYRIIFTANNRRFEAHTNQDGSVVYWFET